MPVFVLAPADTPRLRYVLDWLQERLSCLFAIISNSDDVDEGNLCISYVHEAVGSNTITLPDSGLLWERNIHEITHQTGSWNNVPTLFADQASDCSIPFDLFAAIFFCLSRYEEYLSHTPDEHGRFPHTASVFYKNDWLESPLVDEWVQQLAVMLNASGVALRQTLFSFQPSYDIDIAWSYRHKGISRSFGAAARELLQFNFSSLLQRVKVYAGLARDPYDAFVWMHQLHVQYNLKPYYFILAALHTTPFDKNIHPAHPAMRQLIKKLAEEGTIGMHPSYYSSNQEQGNIDKERKILEQISARTITQSRQHFIKMKLPGTYRELIALGITDDWSMGYGQHIGFRAGTGASFFWYDLKTEQQQPLRIHPFAFMDSTAHYHMKLADAFDRLEAMRKKLVAANSCLVTVLHNFSLSTEKEWKGWPEAYASFVARTVRDYR